MYLGGVLLSIVSICNWNFGTFITLLILSSFWQYCSLQGKSQIVQDELVRLGEQMVNSAEGTRAIALQLCREFEDKFLLHITGGEVSNFFQM